jgi:ABC-2 type transport system ATP-binding protein
MRGTRVATRDGPVERSRIAAGSTLMAQGVDSGGGARQLSGIMQFPIASVADRQAVDRPAAGQAIPDPGLAISVRGLSKHYVHPWTLRVTRGLDALDLDVRRGEVMGLLGPNGAGKTTTLKLLTGLLKPTHGQAWLMGDPVESTASRRSLGFLPEHPYFYDYLNGLEYLELAAQLSGLPAATARERARHWLGRVGLGERPRLGLRKYSKGMLQRLGLAAALVHDPELLILDEPMSGLDPFGRRDVRDLITEQRERGVTVLFSSHILPDVEMLCDRVAIMIGGRLTRVATVGELVEDGAQAVEIRCAPGALLELPRHWAGLVARTQRADEAVFRLEDEARLGEVLGWLLQAGVQVRAVTPQRPTLETLFLAAAEAERERRPA